MIINTSIVPEKYSNYRIDTYLAERFNYLSRSKWQNEISSGKLLYNGIILKNHHQKLKHGDIVSYTGRGDTEPEVLTDYRVLYQDNWILAVDKPGNLPVHPSGIFLKNTLLYILESDYNQKLFPIHRLDRETSGIILFAKNQETASSIQKNFKLVNKTYLAIVEGNPKNRFFTDSTPIGNHSGSAVRKKRKAFLGAGESAITNFTLLYSKKGYSLVKAVPVTGRTHQIRVHLEHSGYPILGDKLYGIDESCYLHFIENGNTIELLEKLKFHRSALHSSSINFYHPGKKVTIKIKAPFPDDFLNFLKLQDPC